MDCKNCANYEPKTEEPTPHPNRIFTENLRVGMVIRRHNAGILKKLVVILGEPGETIVASLQTKVGYDPYKCDLYLANSGLQPYKNTGRWSETWCEEVK